MSRRDFLNRSAALSVGAILLGNLDTITHSAAAAPGGRPSPSSTGGYGPLVNDPAGRLALPRGFRYTVVAEAGATKLESGHPTPADADGTASFVGPDTSSILVNNHEVGSNQDTDFPVPALAELTYDPGAKGGTTTIHVNAEGNRIREYASLCGTDNNCAGGRTPWNTWLTCEKTERRAGEAGNTKDHGFVFEVDPYHPEHNQDPRPLTFLGRYSHEALAVDPTSGAIYVKPWCNASNSGLRCS